LLLSILSGHFPSLREEQNIEEEEMRRKALQGVLLVLVAACSPPLGRSASPQEEKPGKSAAATAERQARPDYRVEYAVRELEEGKGINARSYKVLVQEGEWSRIRVGSRVPYVVGSLIQGQSTGALATNQIQYQDVGINIDCKVQEAGDSGVLLNTRFESSNLPGETRNVGAGVSNPVFRQVRAEGTAVVPLGKPTVIDVVDDVASTREYEIEVTVTKVK
jgi:hypothetical protein